MSDDRLFNKKLGHSQKVNALTSDEEIVWRTYVQEADDFGVMRFAATPIQDGHDRFASRSVAAVMKMLTRVCDVGLIRTFEHQGRTYGYQHDWQNFQKKRYAKGTIHPRIPVQQLEQCTPQTQWLHTLWPGGDRKAKLSSWEPPSGWLPPDWSLWVPSRSGNGSGNGSVSARQNGSADRAITDTHTAFEESGKGDPRVRTRGVLTSDELSERAGRFVERYAELFAEYRHGARYISRPNLDYLEALQLVAVWDNARLEQLAIAFLTTDEPFCRNGSGTIAQFRSRASWCDAKLRGAGL